MANVERVFVVLGDKLYEIQEDLSSLACDIKMDGLCRGCSTETEGITRFSCDVRLTMGYDGGWHWKRLG